METLLHIGNKSFAPSRYLSRQRTVITIGRHTEAVHNVIALDTNDIDTFQCQLTYDDGQWTIRSGQWRTECPKGLRSSRQHACSFCPGCCVNPVPAHPHYSWRQPLLPTLVNGQPLLDHGLPLRNGDVIMAGRVEIRVAIPPFTSP